MKISNTFKTIAIGSVVALGASAPAFAGTSVTNEYRNGVTNIKNGYTFTEVNVNETYNQENLSQSIKVETYGGDTNISIAEFDGTTLTGYAESTNRRVVDPVAIITYASSNEWLEGSLNVYNFSENNFSGYERFNSHTVSSSF